MGSHYVRSMSSIHVRVFALVVAALAVLVADAYAQVAAQVYVSGLNLPVAFAQDPSDPTVQFVVQQGGLIRVIKDGILQATPFLDLSSAISTTDVEQGLLGMAVDPAYGSNGRFYVNFSDLSGHTVVARFKRSAGNPLIADPSSRFDFLWSTGERFVFHPFVNHYGGTLDFGPDGYLYIGMGDGGGDNDPTHLAQNPNSLLGKMLRIDVNVSDADVEGFDIPPTNPFLDSIPVAALPEIWSFGLRNPWKFTFDMPSRGGNGAMLIGDVGEFRWEEINYEPAGRGGRNYGWRNYEGSQKNVQTDALAFSPPVMPIFEYDQYEGIAAVMSGYVYRGTALNTGFKGRYFFADLTGRVWSLKLNVNPTTGEAFSSDLREHTAELSNQGALGFLTGFGVDSAGELYVIGYTTGRLIKIVDTGAPFVPGPPTAAADFNGDKHPDILWQNQSNGYLAAWTMNGTTQTAASLLTPDAVGDTNWKIVATARINSDFKTDIVWQNQATGQLALWIMNGTTILEATTFEHGRVFDAAWKVVAAADMNGDGRTDLIWRHTQGWIAVWFMDGLRLIDSALLGPGQVADPDWTIVGAGDFNSDGRNDLVWHHRQGWIAVWFMNGAQQLGTALPSVDRVADTDWDIVGIWDPNADGHSDFLWYRRRDGFIATWLMNGMTVVQSVLLNPGQVADTTWRIAGPR